MLITTYQDAISYHSIYAVTNMVSNSMSDRYCTPDYYTVAVPIVCGLKCACD